MGESAVMIELERPAKVAVTPASTEQPDLELSCVCNNGCGIWYLEDGQGHLIAMWRPGGWCWTAARGVVRT